MAAYREYMEHSMSQRIEEVLLSPMYKTKTQNTTWKFNLFRHLADAGVPLQLEAKGYIMMPDNISTNSWDTVQTCSEASYRLNYIHEALR